MLSIAASVALLSLGTAPIALADGEGNTTDWGRTIALSERVAAVAEPTSSHPEERGDGDATAVDPVQDELVSIAQRIYALVDPTEGARNVTGDGRTYGYSGLKIDVDRAALDLYWVGDIPSNVREIISDTHATRVEVHPATWTLFEMQDASRTLINERARAFPKGVVVTLTGPRISGDGVNLEYWVTAGAVEAKQVGDAARQLVDIPVKVEEVSGPSTPLSRQNPSSPYKGGAGYTDNPGGHCSVGFGVTGNNSGDPFLLSAYHCFYPSQSTVNFTKPKTGAVYGNWTTTATRNSPDFDATLLRPTSGTSAAGQVITGGVDSTTVADITGQGFNTPGEQVCLSGGNSGTHCTGFYVIEKNNFTAYGADGTVLSSVVRGGNTTGAVLAVGGDSGGSIYYLSSSRTARGILSQGWPGYQESCSNTVTWTSTSKCFSRVYWVGVTSILDELNVSLLTN